MKILFLKSVLLFFFISLLFSGNIAGQPTKTEAEEFSLRVIKEYFNKNCDSYMQLVHDTLFKVGENGCILKTHIYERFCSRYNSIIDERTDSSYTFSDYLNNYDYETLSYYEFNSLYHDALQDKMCLICPVYTTDCFFFRGGKTKQAKKDFIHNDSLFFVVKKTPNGWRIVAP